MLLDLGDIFSLDRGRKIGQQLRAVDGVEQCDEDLQSVCGGLGIFGSGSQDLELTLERRIVTECPGCIQRQENLGLTDLASGILGRLVCQIGQHFGIVNAGTHKLIPIIRIEECDRQLEHVDIGPGR